MPGSRSTSRPSATTSTAWWRPCSPTSDDASFDAPEIDPTRVWSKSAAWLAMSYGAPHRHFRVTDSTNARARELVEAGAPGGTVVTADEQTAGRGRQGRSWTAPPRKALLYSAVLRPMDERHLLLPLSVPLAVCE